MVLALLLIPLAFRLFLKEQAAASSSLTGKRPQVLTMAIVSSASIIDLSIKASRADAVTGRLK